MYTRVAHFRLFLGCFGGRFYAVLPGIYFPFSKQQPSWADAIVSADVMEPGRFKDTAGWIVYAGVHVALVDSVAVAERLPSSYLLVCLESVKGDEEALYHCYAVVSLVHGCYLSYVVE